MTSLNLEFECPGVTKRLRLCTPQERRDIMAELIVIAETRLGILNGGSPSTPEQWAIARAEVMDFLDKIKPVEPVKEPDLFEKMRAATE